MAAVTDAPRLRRHVLADLRASLSVRAAHVDARSPDARPRRLEHRHRLSRQRGAQPRPRPTARPRRPLRHGRRVPRRRLQTVGTQLGRRTPCVADKESRRLRGPGERSTAIGHHGAHFKRARHPPRASRRRNAHRCSTRPARPSRGLVFAGTHAECVFIAAPTEAVQKKAVDGHPRGRRRGRPTAPTTCWSTARRCSSWPATTGEARGEVRRTIARTSTSTARSRCCRDGPASTSRPTTPTTSSSTSRTTRAAPRWRRSRPPTPARQLDRARGRAVRRARRPQPRLRRLARRRCRRR